MLARIKTGPSRVVVWHVDRLYRRPRELEDLIDLVESHPIRIEAVMGAAFDLNTHEGRLMARQLVAMAAYESGHKADRIRRANRQKAERGDWHGAPKFGYGLGGVVIPEQAVVVREMADRFLAGQSLRSITKWLNEESGVPSPRADKGTLGVWHATTVKSILVSAPALEELVSGAVIARLAVTELPTPSPDSSGVVGDAMARIVAARARLEDLARDYGAGALSRAEFHAARVAAQGAIHDAELALGKVNRASALKGLPIGDEAALRYAWAEEWSIPQKRAILTSLIDTLVVNPDPNCGSRFRPERVDLLFKA
ncbi:MAG: hypothetical protein ABS81_04910 [Pseudonocardia sp. SCN 72-86]|nr:MAG: hypothetical protein ABS81_04910 [Pseudonocardia sp. SCN 72-86]